MDRREWWRCTCHRSPGQKAGVRAGDVLTASAICRSRALAQATQALATLREWTEAKYSCLRDGKPFEPKVIVGEASTIPRSTISTPWARCIWPFGLFVYFPPRERAARAALLPDVPDQLYPIDLPLHGKLNYFDQSIYLGTSSRDSWRPPCSCISAAFFRSRKDGSATKPRRSRYIFRGSRCWCCSSDLYLAGCGRPRH